MRAKIVFKVVKKDRKKDGERFSPCLTPLQHGKKGDVPSLFFIRDLMLSYIFLIRVKHLPFIL